MTILHIEHAVTDYDAWRAVYDAFADARRHGGVTADHVARPVGDPRYVVITLELDSVERARAFVTFLETQVWSSPATAPALSGTPRTAILEPA